MNIFILIAFIVTNAELIKIHEEVKESFEGNNRWTIKNGKVQKEFCNSKLVFGGFGGQTVISKLLIVPTHAYIKIGVDIWSSNQWGQVKVYLDHVEILSVQIQQRCSENDYYLSTFTSEFTHSGASIILVMSGNGEENDNKVLIKLRASGDFEIWKFQLKNGDIAETCQIWKSVQNSWTAAHTNFMGLDGWMSINGISGSSKCGGVPLIGGYQRFGNNQGLSKTIRLQPHYKLRLLVLWAKIDSWDNENGLILFDGKQVWNQSFNNDNGYQVKVCGNSESKYHTLFKRIDITVDHSGAQVKIDFQSSLDQGSDDESFGLRDLQLFYAPCQDQCEVCKGEFGSECIRCSNYQFQTLNGCSAPRSYYILERNFYAQKFTSLEGWILKETQQNLIITNYQDKTIVGGYGILGVGATAEKLFILPPHTQLRLEVTLYKIDSWDGENIIIEVDSQDVWDSQRLQDSQDFLYGTAYFGTTIYASCYVTHDKQEALVRIKSTLDEGADNESWGFRDFCLMYDVANVVEISDAQESYLLTLGIVMIISFI